SDPARVDSHVGHGLLAVDVNERGVRRDALRCGMLMRCRWQRSEHADYQQHAETKTNLRETVALKGALRGSVSQPRGQVQTVDAGNSYHGGEQANLEGDQPAVAGNHKIAWAAQQIPAIDETAGEQSTHTEDTDNREATCRADGEFVPEGLGQVARLPKQKCECRQAPEPCGGSE